MSRAQSIALISGWQNYHPFFSISPTSFCFLPVPVPSPSLTLYQHPSNYPTVPLPFNWDSHKILAACMCTLMCFPSPTNFFYLGEAKRRWARHACSLYTALYELFTYLIITIIIQMSMFIVLSSWHNHCESSPGSFDECRTAPSGRRQKARRPRL